MTGYQLLARDKAGHLPPEDDPFYPRFWPDRLEKLDRFLRASRKPVGVFLNIMGEWAGDWVPESWQNWMFEIIRRYPQHRFYLLTHQPQNLIKFSPFPPNCYVGITATTKDELEVACSAALRIQARIIFLSVEPFLERLTKPEWLIMPFRWLIIGAMTGTGDIEGRDEYLQLSPMPYGNRYTLQPRIEWVEEIVKAADKAGIPVFLKDNLLPLMIDSTLPEKAELFYNETGLRQEMPELESLKTEESHASP